MKTTVAEAPEILRLAADCFMRQLEGKNAPVIALGANDDCLALYRELSRRCAEGRLDLTGARFFAVGEFEGLPSDDPRSCRSRLREALLAAADPAGERSFFPSADNAAEYDALIAAAGGPDLAVLGVGTRGRIGFNEPATAYDSGTHRQKLTKATKRELAPIFGGEEQTPDFAYTMGIHTILSAGAILVPAFGEERAEPVFRMLYARTDSFVPAAFLQLPLQVEIFLDSAAAGKL